MDNYTVTKLNDAKKWIQTAVRFQQSSLKNGRSCSYLYLAGPPGIGKSEMFEQICQENGWGLIVKYMGTLLTEQITGLPKATSEDSNFTEWTIPEIFNFKNPRVQRNPNQEGQPIILLLDDAHLCTKTIQSYMFQLLTYRCIHDHILPDDVIIFLAGNRSSDAANFQNILAPISNRLDFREVKAEVDDWVSNFAIKNNVRQDIIAFLQHTEGSFQTTPLESQPWASPRSWTHASYHIDAYIDNFGEEPELDDLLNILAGHVGYEPATSFVEFKEYLMKWNSRGILEGKENMPNINQLCKVDCYALMTALSNDFINILKEKNFKQNKETESYVDRFLDIAIKDMLEQIPELVPLGLKNIALSEKEHSGSHHFIKKLLNSNDVTTELVDLM